MSPHRSRRRAGAALTLVAALGLSACGSTSGAADLAASTLTVVTHDSFSLDSALLDQFAAETGYEVTYVAPGDAGTLVNQLILTQDSPLGDVVYGIDNTFAGRALSHDILVPYTPAALDADTLAPYAADDTGRLTPIDIGDVCVNADTGWFADHDLELPQSLDDLTDPAYADLFVTPNPASSSPGMAFLAASVGDQGDPGYLDYWARLTDNGVLITQDWTEAYTAQFSGSSGAGPRPLVLSYATSPAYEAVDGEASTQALLGTCFRQVEYAGIINGAANPEGAQAFIEFLLSNEVQADLPTQMYMYPVSPEVDLPAEWVSFAPLADDPIDVPAATIGENRDRWIT
ncbi:MAG: thiamine ABC transporter substrate binding subunit, partial [Propioniciclava sp.]